MMEQTREELAQQYRDASNLNARSAIYRFATSSGNPTPWPRWVFDQFAPGLPDDARVLELGCGDGALWKKNRDRTPAGWRVTLCDLSPGMLAASAGLGFGQLLADAAALPLVDRAFDAVVANHMLYHVADRAAALAGIARVLRPGGKLYAATNSSSHLSQMKDLVEYFLGERSPLSGLIPFNLENGREQLAPFFDHVEIRPVKEELRVTDPAVVVGYVMSINEAQKEIVGARRDELERMVRDQIDREGAFVCQTATGMFVATSKATP